MSVILGIIPMNAPSMPVSSFKFAIPEEFAFSYSTEFGDWKNLMRTHTPMKWWKSGKVEPIEVNLKLAAGGAEYASWTSPSIDTSDAMISLIESLHNLTLPPSTDVKYLEPVILFLSSLQGKIWFKCRCYLTDVSETFKPPYDVDTGKPMVVDPLSLSFAPYFGPTVTTDSEAAAQQNSKDLSLPKRPFKFSNLVNP